MGSLSLDRGIHLYIAMLSFDMPLTTFEMRELRLIRVLGHRARVVRGGSSQA